MKQISSNGSQIGELSLEKKSKKTWRKFSFNNDQTVKKLSEWKWRIHSDNFVFGQEPKIDFEDWETGVHNQQTDITNNKFDRRTHAHTLNQLETARYFCINQKPAHPHPCTHPIKQQHTPTHIHYSKWMQ